jgi:LDH2 family malate/lactate/ureidoglycolate dehydrogenase
VIDPSAFGDPLLFKQRVDDIVREMRGSERMPGVDRIWVPGEQSQAKRVQYGQQGIPIPPALLQQLDALAAQLKVPALRDTRF